MLAEGTKAPAFSLPSTSGGSLSLADLAGKTVVLYFYPKDDTPGCTVEACDFRDARARLSKAGAVVVGVSRDSLGSHDRFRAKYGLDFPLLSDADAKVIEAYGAWGEKNMYGKKSMGIVRTTVVIGPDGTVRKVFPRVKVKGHVDAVLASLGEGAARRPAGGRAKPAEKAAERKAPAKKAPAKKAPAKKAPAKKAPAKKASAKKAARRPRARRA